MANKTTYRKGVTGVGEALFAHLISPEQYQGKSTNKFTVMLKLNEKDKAKLLKEIDEEWEKFKESDEGKEHKYKYDYNNSLKEYQDEEYFKFKMTHIIQTKKGEWERHVPIFDASQKDISGSITNVGNGSKIKVAYELVPFYVTSKNYGITLRMTAVQVLDLKEYSDGNASDFGFGTEKGYVQEDDAVPFFDGGSADNEEEDF